MGTIVALVGTFGSAMAFFGALMALFTGGLGVISGADEAGSLAGRSFGAVAAAFMGLAGSVVARTRLRVGASTLLASAVLGVLLIWWFYLVGAVLMLAAVGIAFWMRADPE